MVITKFVYRCSRQADIFNIKPFERDSIKITNINYKNLFLFSLIAISNNFLKLIKKYDQ